MVTFTRYVDVPSAPAALTALITFLEDLGPSKNLLLGSQIGTTSIILSLHPDYAFPHTSVKQGMVHFLGSSPLALKPKRVLGFPIITPSLPSPPLPVPAYRSEGGNRLGFLFPNQALGCTSIINLLSP